MRPPEGRTPSEGRLAGYGAGVNWFQDWRWRHPFGSRAPITMTDFGGKNEIGASARRAVAAVTSSIGGHSAALGSIDAITVGATHFDLRAGRTPLPSHNGIGYSFPGSFTPHEQHPGQSWCFAGRTPLPSQIVVAGYEIRHCPHPLPHLHRTSDKMRSQSPLVVPQLSQRQHLPCSHSGHPGHGRSFSLMRYLSRTCTWRLDTLPDASSCRAARLRED